MGPRHWGLPANSTFVTSLNPMMRPISPCISPFIQWSAPLFPDRNLTISKEGPRSTLDTATFHSSDGGTPSAAAKPPGWRSWRSAAGVRMRPTVPNRNSAADLAYLNSCFDLCWSSRRGLGRKFDWICSIWWLDLAPKGLRRRRRLRIPAPMSLSLGGWGTCTRFFWAYWRRSRWCVTLNLCLLVFCFLVEKNPKLNLLSLSINELSE